MEQKFIAISESEYNSFKHGEYERKIKELEDKIAELEQENIKIAKAKAVRIEISEAYSFNGHSTNITVYSDSNFENEILESIKNTELSHVVKLFTEKDDFVKIGETYYYKNKWCEKLKSELKYLASKVKDLQEKRDELESEVKILKRDLIDKDETDNLYSPITRDEHILKKIINKFGGKHE